MRARQSRAGQSRGKKRKEPLFVFYCADLRIPGNAYSLTPLTGGDER